MNYDEKTLKRLRSADWETISLKLLKFAIAVAGHSLIAKGMDAEDVVKEVITKTFSGERKWNPKIALYVHLKEAVRSTLSNKGLMGCKDRTLRANISPENHEITSEENEQRLTDELLELRILIKGNKDLVSVFEAILAGDSKPQDIAATTGIDPLRVREHKRSLKRRWIKTYGGNP